MYAGDVTELFRNEARALMREARSTGHPVGILTNDLRAFHSDEWVDGLRLGELVDVVVDGSAEGILKPHPRIYELTAQRLAWPCTTWCSSTTNRSTSRAQRTWA
jgi:putative hydrolase of the HAD superfamily